MTGSTEDPLTVTVWWHRSSKKKLRMLIYSKYECYDTKYPFQSTCRFKTSEAERRHRLMQGGWKTLAALETPATRWFCSLSIFMGIKTQSMSTGWKLIPVALCFVWAQTPFIIYHQSARERMKEPQSDYRQVHGSR